MFRGIWWGMRAGEKSIRQRNMLQAMTSPSAQCAPCSWYVCRCPGPREEPHCSCCMLKLWELSLPSFSRCSNIASAPQGAVARLHCGPLVYHIEPPWPKANRNLGGMSRPPLLAGCGVSMVLPTLLDVNRTDIPLWQHYGASGA